MADKPSNVVLNFKTDGQVQYAKTIRDINAIMNAAAKEYRNHVAEMGKDVSATQKLAAEKKKLEIQMEAAKQRTQMLRNEYEALSNNTNTTAAKLANMHGRLLDSERAEHSLEAAMKKVNSGMTEQAEQTRRAEEALDSLAAESAKLGGATEKLNAEYKLQQAQLGDNASEAEKLSAQMDHLNKSHEIAGEQVANYEQQLEAAKKQYGENAEEVDKYEIQLLEAQAAEQSLANELANTKLALAENAIATSEAAQSLDQLKNSEDGLATASEKLTAEYELQKAQLGDNASESEKLSAQMDHLNKAHELAGQKVANYEKQLEEAKKQYGDSSSEVDKYERQLLEARTAEQTLANEIKTTNTALVEQNNKLKQTSEQLKTAGDKMTSVGKSLSMKVTAPIAGVGAAAIKIGSDFEAGMSKVSAVSGATGKEFDALEKQARDLGKSTQFSATEAAEGMEYLALAGFKTSDIMSAMPGMLNLAAAGSMDLGRAADIASDTMSAFGLAAEHASHTADVFAFAQANANTNVEQMGEGMKYLAPMAHSVGWELEGTSAAMMALADSGLKGSIAGQAFASSLARLSDPGDKAEKMMKKMNVEFFNAQGEMKSVTEMTKELEDGMEGMSKKQQAAALKTIFGTEAYKHWAILLETGSDKLAENTEELKNADGAAEDMAKTMRDNLKGQLEQLSSALTEIAIKIYKSMEPALKAGVKVLQLFVKAIDLIPGPIIAVLVVIAGLIASIGPLLLVLGILASSFSSILGAVGPAMTVLAKLGPIFTVIKTAILGINLPITLAVAAVIGLTILIVKNWETIKEVTVAVFGAIGGLIAAGWEKAAELTKTAFKGITEFLKKWGPDLLIVLSGPIGWVIAFFVKNWDEIKKKTVDTFTSIRSFLEDLWIRTVGKIISIVGKLVDTVHGKWKLFKSVTEEVFFSIRDFFERIWNAVKSTVTTIITRAIDGWTKTFERFRATAERIWNAVKDAILKPINLAKDGVKKAIDTIRGLFDFEFKWPKLKIPKIEVSGSMNPLKWMEEGVPKFDVKWNAKGGIFTKPTIFGASGSQLQGAGEAGPEAVLPLNDKTLGAIGKAIAETMGEKDSDIVLTVEVPIDGEVVARKTVKYTMREIYNAQQRDRRGRD